MRARVLGTVLIAGAIVFAPAAWSQSRGGGRGGSGHWSGGGHGSRGGHHGSVRGGHTGHRRGGFRGFRAPGWRGGVRGYRGSDWGLYLGLGLPLWWDSYWGWPYGYYGYYGYGGYPYNSVTLVPPVAEASGAAETPAAPPAEAGPTVSGPSLVEFEVSPNGALVYLNGVLVGSVEEFDGRPDYLYLDPGQYTLELRSPGYLTRTLRLSVNDGNKVVLALDLSNDPTVKAPSASPSSPGLPFGRRFAPEFGPGKIERPPGAAAQAAGSSGLLSTALELHVSPGSAAVYVDGVLVGTGEGLERLAGGIAVAPGPHRIDVVAPGHAAKTLQVEAKAGTKQELTITLE
jgi:hypothetical protein